MINKSYVVRVYNKDDQFVSYLTTFSCFCSISEEPHEHMSTSKAPATVFSSLFDAHASIAKEIEATFNESIVEAIGFDNYIVYDMNRNKIQRYEILVF